MAKRRALILYNLFPLLAGPFPAWTPHIERAARLGFTWLFVNPIQRTGRSRSLYSVADYFAFDDRLVDSQLGTPADTQVREMLADARAHGLDAMVDLVVNHCSIDADILREHPAWIVWEKSGHAAHPFAMQNGRKVVWGDLAKIDHAATRDPEGLFQYFLRVVRFLWDLGFRGFRCDAAYQVPRSFWRRLIAEVKAQHPTAIFAAETLGCPPDQTRRTASAGFDYIFNSAKWWDMHQHWLLEQYDLTREIAPSISFPESHDTERLLEECHGNEAAVRQRFLFTALFSAGVMVPMGFEFGFRRRLHVVQTTPADWEAPSFDLSDFIRSVNLLKAQHQVFQEECPTQMLHTSNPQVLVMWKASTTCREEALVILSKDAHHRQHVRIDDVRSLVQSGAPLSDVTPGADRLEHIPAPFEYELRPGEGRVLMTARDIPPRVV